MTLVIVGNSGADVRLYFKQDLRRSPGVWGGGGCSCKEAHRTKGANQSDSNRMEPPARKNVILAQTKHAEVIR